MTDKVAELALQLRAGRSLTSSRRALLVLCGLLVASGYLLTVITDDPVPGWAVVLGFSLAFVLVLLGWQSGRRIWLAREGLVFETPAVRYHLPWDAVSEVTLVGKSVFGRVQLKVRDVEEVVATVRRKRRGGKLQAQARVRRAFTLNYWAGRCHVEFVPLAFGVDAAALHAVLVGYAEDAGRRAELAALPVSEDMSAGAPTPQGAPGKSGPQGS